MGDTNPDTQSTAPHASVDNSFRIHITPYNGVPSKLEAFLDDLEYLWTTKSWDATRDTKIMAATIFMNCTDTVKINLRLLSAQKKHSHTELIAHLKATYGIQSQEFVSSSLEQLTNIHQNADESLRDYITRAQMILDHLTEHQSALNLSSIGNGEIALHYVRKGIRNKMHRELLMLGSNSWAEFLPAVARLYQADAKSFNPSKVDSPLIIEINKKISNNMKGHINHLSSALIIRGTVPTIPRTANI